MITTIRFLDSKKEVSVEAPLALHVGWGDRVSRYQDGPCVFGSLAGLPYGTPGDLRAEAGQLGNWWERNPSAARGTRDSHGADLTDQQRADVLATYEAVGAAWRDAVANAPEIAAAVEAYRQIQDGIERQYVQHERQWMLDAARIAKAFRRAAVEIGEQTVPGKVCVRSSRGKLLGYADVWDGRWLGTVERA